MRTEPWPAPAVSVSAAVTPGATVAYTLASGSVRMEFKGRRARYTATIERLEGTLDFDPARPENTRGSVRADLLALAFSPPAGASTDENALTLTALRALELGAERPAEDRDRDRWALVRITGFAPRGNDERAAKAKTPVTASAELTLHRFRVPLTLELEVELVQSAGGVAPVLRVRTRQPFVVQLAAHDLEAADPARSDVAQGPARGRDGIREARVSAELSWRPAGVAAPALDNP